jgi:hypothetical protein
LNLVCLEVLFGGAAGTFANIEHRMTHKTRHNRKLVATVAVEQPLEVSRYLTACRSAGPLISLEVDAATRKRTINSLPEGAEQASKPQAARHASSSDPDQGSTSSSGVGCSIMLSSCRARPADAAGALSRACALQGSSVYVPAPAPARGGGRSRPTRS